MEGEIAVTVLEYLLERDSLSWDGTRNGSLDPGGVTVGSHRKVWWRCGRGHSWEAAVYSVTVSGSGCPYCMGKAALPGENDLATLFPNLANQWDYEKNPGKPEEILPGAHEKVWWRCSLGHSWQAAPFSRTKEKGSGCPYCTGKKTLPGFNDLGTLRPRLADEWYQPMNGGLTPDQVSLGSNKKVWWRCDRRHIWQAAIYSRTRTRAAGCPICTGTVKAPKPTAHPHRFPSKNLPLGGAAERSEF
jgi:hypothetical protein